MFRFLELTLHGWDLWPPIRVPLDRDVVMLTGPNGSGKTTFLDAIRQLLNAQRLSSHRRVHHYLRRAERPAIVAAVVSNDASGRMQPFARERIVTPEATLACALVPDRSGTPEKRFVVLPGRPPFDEVRRILLESRDFMGPERYGRVLEAAGVTSSLMHVLAIEQGRTNTLFELKPRELFRKVLEMAGDQGILERYREAHRRYAESDAEVFRQAAALQSKEEELRAAERQVRSRDDWEEADERVRDLEARLPAARLQAVIARRREAAPKSAELETKVARGVAAMALLVDAASRARDALLAATVSLEQSREAAGAARAARDEAHGRALSAARDLADLEAMAKERDALPEADLAILRARLAAADDAAMRATGATDSLRSMASDLQGTLDDLEAGRAVLPKAVRDAMAALADRGIEASVLATLAEPADGACAAAIEAALGDARHALVVEPLHEEAAIEEARRHQVPGPVWAGAVEPGPRRDGMLILKPGAPAWLTPWIGGVELREDGSWRDGRGTWVRAADESLLGETGRAARIVALRARIATTAQELGIAEASGADAVARRNLAGREVAAGERRQQLDASLARCPEIALARDRAQELLARADRDRDAADRAREAAHQAHHDAGLLYQQAQSETTAASDRLRGEKDALERLRGELLALDLEERDLAAAVPADLCRLAELGDLDGEETVRKDLDRARRRLDELGGPPPALVREEARHLAVNVEELRRHVHERRREAEDARAELDQCRSRYLEVVQGALHEYRKRATALAKVADVVLDMELPSLRDDDAALDEAAILARFGFDGKDPLPLGDPSFSGGQQVIAGLVLLMAMAETEGRGFFMLDEPFAHLSLDRVDQVGRFLRGTRSQFLLTAPTTLDRAQLDPAAMVIVLSKKRPGEANAPVPLVALA